jgi:hypothetical protein
MVLDFLEAFALLFDIGRVSDGACIILSVTLGKFKIGLPALFSKSRIWSEL